MCESQLELKLTCFALQDSKFTEAHSGRQHFWGLKLYACLCILDYYSRISKVNMYCVPSSVYAHCV